MAKGEKSFKERKELQDIPDGDLVRIDNPYQQLAPNDIVVRNSETDIWSLDS